MPHGEIPLALFAFNLGVELGQLSFIAAVLLAWRLIRILAGATPTLAAPRLAGYAIGITASFWGKSLSLGANGCLSLSCELIVAGMATMNGDDQRGEIVRLEIRIDEIEATIESCRKFILAGRIAVAGGSVILILMLMGVIQINPLIMAIAMAAVLGGIVAAGSNRSTAREVTHELTALEAKRATLIAQLELQLIPNRES